MMKTRLRQTYQHTVLTIWGDGQYFGEWAVENEINTLRTGDADLRF